MSEIIQNIAIVIGVIIIVFVVVGLIGLVMGFPIMWLWNWLLPDLFNISTITYWQSVGIFYLSTFLFRSYNYNK